MSILSTPQCFIIISTTSRQKRRNKNFKVIISIIKYQFILGVQIFLQFQVVYVIDSTLFNQETVVVFILALNLVQALVQSQALQKSGKECPVDKPRDCGTFCCQLNYMCCALAINGQVYETCMEFGSPCPPDYCMCSLF